MCRIAHHGLALYSILPFAVSKLVQPAFFCKKNALTFARFRKKQYLCTRFPENGTAETNKLLTQTVKKGSKKKEFFEKIYIKQKVVVQEASEKSLG